MFRSQGREFGWEMRRAGSSGWFKRELSPHCSRNSHGRADPRGFVNLRLCWVVVIWALGESTTEFQSGFGLGGPQSSSSSIQGHLP